MGNLDVDPILAAVYAIIDARLDRCESMAGECEGKGNFLRAAKWDARADELRQLRRGISVNLSGASASVHPRRARVEREVLGAGESPQALSD